MFLEWFFLILSTCLSLAANRKSAAANLVHGGTRRPGMLALLQVCGGFKPPVAPSVGIVAVFRRFYGTPALYHNIMQLEGMTQESGFMLPDLSNLTIAKAKTSDKPAKPSRRGQEKRPAPPSQGSFSSGLLGLKKSRVLLRFWAYIAPPRMHNTFCFGCR